jgi:phenylpyruvate tautomerase PptA (4-oxalocrotonate tautomerase family)
VKATNAYAAKRALIGRLTALSQVVGHPLEGVQVGYARPGQIGDRCIYGGKARINYGGRSQYSALDDGDAEGQTAHEVVTAEFYIRALGRGLDEEATEQIVEGYADVIADELVKNRELGLGLTYAGITAGVADFWPVDDGTEAILALSIDIGSWLT